MSSNLLSEVWQKSLDILQKELSKPSFETWLKATNLIARQDNTIVIAVPNEFAKEWLESRYTNLIKNTLQMVINEEVEVVFVISQQENAKSKSKKAARVQEISDETHLNAKYTFDSFVVGNSNRFAHAASLAVAEAPAKAYNPFFIYGGVGLGKTHLMHAIGQYVLANDPKARVMYVTSEKFTNELINAIRENKTVSFRNKYRNIDVLLVDDIQFLAGKESTQEEFFHTFNTLHEANKQLIISSDRPPREIPTLEDRLRSRFEWGLITDIQAPDLETRIAILRKKALVDNIEIPNDVMQYIASRIQSNIRELEGALIRVVAYCSLNGKKITAELTDEILKDILPPPKLKRKEITTIQKTVADYFGLRTEELKAKNRARNVAFPRQIAMYLSRKLTDTSLPKVGQEFGGRDHTTVMHACDKISELIKQSSLWNEKVNQIIAQIENNS